MDPRLLKYYNRELQYMREMGGEFAAEFPKIAGRLGLDGFECADPYVERLLEGFAFLAARVQLKLDSQFPTFTQHLLEIVYPHFLAPIPSMAVLQLQPNLSQGDLAKGFKVPRGSSLRSLLGKGEQTACTYRTAHDVTLWPIELTEAEYFTRNYSRIKIPAVPGVEAGLRLRLRSTAGKKFSQTKLESLNLFLRGADEQPMRLYEQILGNAAALVVQPAGEPKQARVIDAAHIRPVGFEENQSLLPAVPRSFQGYRLLQEYFALPERFLFAELGGLGPAVQALAGSDMELLVLFDRVQPDLENTVDANDFALHCTPAVNLFPRRCDRINLDSKNVEHHILPDRTRPLDLEVHSVTEVKGYGVGSADEQEFLPFYATCDTTAFNEDLRYYTLHRVPRQSSSKQKQYGPRSTYVGSETYISLVDAREAPYSSELRQLEVQALCTNRDLPLMIPINKGPSDFSLESGAPVAAVKCVAGPSRPQGSVAQGETAWRLVNHLSLNYLSLLDTDEVQGAAALRELLSLYGDKGAGDAAIRRQIMGILSVSPRPITRRIPTAGPVTFGRGLEIQLSCDEAGFEGTGVYLLGSVLENFFSKYVSINSFTETVLSTQQRGEVMRWPARIGRRQTL